MTFSFHPEAEEEFVEAGGIFILAIMHLHRDPGYWKHRLGTGRTR
jgi:hypothetical protein